MSCNHPDIEDIRQAFTDLDYLDSSQSYITKPAIRHGEKPSIETYNDFVSVYKTKGGRKR